jgi:predicted GIY-YIG superfamily endonuclease
MRSHNYYVYIVASASRTLYVGVTNDLERRVWEHRHKTLGGFTAKYDFSRLGWFECRTQIDYGAQRLERHPAGRRSRPEGSAASLFAAANGISLLLRQEIPPLA